MNLKVIFLLIIIFLSRIPNANAQSYQWDWATASRGGVEGWRVCTDAWGNVFGAGLTQNNYAIFGTDTLNMLGWESTAIMKCNTSGKILWALTTHYGDNGPTNIATDAYGNLYLFGIYQDDSIQVGPFLLHKQGIFVGEYFLAKFSPSGNVIWAKNIAYIGTSNGDLSYGGMSLSGNNIFVTGPFYEVSTQIGNNVLYNNGQVNANAPLNPDIFIAKLDSGGNVLWAKSAGGDSTDISWGISATPQGYTYTIGIFLSDSIKFGSNTLIHDPVYNGNSSNINLFIAKYDALGNTVWAKKIGGSPYSVPSLSSDQYGNFYVTGRFDSVLNLGNRILNANSNGNLYIAKFDSSGNTIWAKMVASHSANGGITTDACGNVWITGRQNQANADTIDGNALNIPSNIIDPTFTAAWNNNGVYITSSIFPSDCYSQLPSDIACDGIGNVYICGYYINGPYTIGNSVLPLETGIIKENMVIAKFAIEQLKDTSSVSTMGCVADSLELIAPIGFQSYLWYDGSTGPTHIADSAGVFWVYCTGACNTSLTTDTFKIKKASVDLELSLGPDITTCAPIVLETSVTADSFLWQDGSHNSYDSVYQSGKYYLTVSKNDCKISDTVNVEFVNIDPQLKDTAVCSDMQINIAASIPSDAFILWSNGSTSNPGVFIDTGMFWAQITDGKCVLKDSFTLIGKNCTCQAFVPNAFTPNNDGRNDYIHPLFPNGCIVTDYKFAIYNRWGQQVFMTQDPNARWDGNFKGLPQDLDTYFYYLEYKTGPIKKAILKKEILL